MHNSKLEDPIELPQTINSTNPEDFPCGIYKITWKNNGTVSYGCIGEFESGGRWIACSGWRPDVFDHLEELYEAVGNGIFELLIKHDPWEETA